MSWERAAQSSALDTWLHKQLRTPSHGLILAKLPALAARIDLFVGELQDHDLEDLRLDDQLGLQPRYRDVSYEGDPDLLTPAFVLAALCYRQGIALTALTGWLSHPQIVLQWLLLPPLAWRSLGLKVDSIPAGIIQSLSDNSTLDAPLFTHWQGHLSVLPKSDVRRPTDSEIYADHAAIHALQATGLSSSQSAKRLFLQIAPKRLLGVSELKALVASHLDLNALPIPLAEPDQVEAYWLWKKELHTPQHADELGMTALNALLVQAVCAPRFDMSHFEAIAHPQKDAAILRLLEADPSKLQQAPSQAKRDKLQNDLGL